MILEFTYRILKKYYNQRVEDFCTRLLYFFNTLDTYFFLAGFSSFLLYLYWFQPGYSITSILLISLVIFIFYKVSDFYPLIVVLSPIFLYFLFRTPEFDIATASILLGLNLAAFIVIQVCFMGMPDSIVARDPTIFFRKIWNSIFTIAPTAVSLSMSLYFATLYSWVLAFSPTPDESFGLIFWVVFLLCCLITRYFKPKSFVSKTFKPEIMESLVQRVIVLNIDGCRLDRFRAANLPFIDSLVSTGTHFPNGLTTVYRALTNPAFASILTGAPPEVHGIKNNNLGQMIQVEGLPDLVKAKLYGSMHVEHFSKPEWDTDIVSLPTHGIYKSDDVMLEMLKDDLKNKHLGIRLFVADLSEVDFLGHAYGSESQQYLEAIERVDGRMEEFFQFLKEEKLSDDSVVIICSDHGMVRIDHSYLLYDAEKFVPFILYGKIIKSGYTILDQASIMDIAPTISYLLGISYPDHSTGRVFVEALDRETTEVQSLDLESFVSST